jgi:acyl-CoA synthetase (AMP-forming)/AMP-acid ligase II
MAGEKISPIEIDGVIEAIPGVREAATFAMLLERLGLEGAPSSAEPSRSPPRASE